MVGSEAPILCNRGTVSGLVALHNLEGNVSLPDDGAKCVERAKSMQLSERTWLMSMKPELVDEDSA